MMCVIGKNKLFLLFLLLFSCVYTFAFEVKVCTFNIRYDSGVDGINSWENRKSLLVNYLNSEEIDIICLQEVLYHQYNYFKREFEEYQAVGVGRNDGKTKGEFAPIFFKKNKFELLDKGTFWLSENPNKVGSKGWDADQPRIATWILLKEAKTSKRFIVVNTHFDNIGKVAKVNSADLLVRWVESQSLPVILTGDFNESPQSVSYDVIVGDNGIKDSYIIAKKRKGVDYSFHNFNKIPVEQRRKIDYVFVKGVKKVKQVHIPREKALNGVFLSDHNPVLSILSF